MTIASTLAIGAAAIGVLAGASLLLPRTVQVERSAVVSLEPAKVIELAASTKGFQSFNPYLTADPNLKITPFGPEAGVGSGFAFDGKDGTGTQTVSHVTDSEVVYQIDLGAMGKPVQTIRAVAAEGGAEVTWMVETDLGMNPVFRVFGLFMDGMLGKTYEQGLANLDRTAV